MGATGTEALLLAGRRRSGQGEETDEALVGRARGGESHAFEQLYLRHRERVYNLCLNLCGNRDQAQDLLQEAFVRAYQGLPKFRGRARFTTWLHRIAVNLCRDAVRRRQVVQVVLDAPPSLLVAKPHDPAAAADIRAALGRLPVRYRTVLALRYGQALSYQEVADLLHWSLAQVKVTLHRARRAFKDAYLGSDESHEVSSSSRQAG